MKFITVLLLTTCVLSNAQSTGLQHNTLSTALFDGLEIDSQLTSQVIHSDTPLAFLKKLAYLTPDSDDREGHTRKSAAIRMIGRIGDTNMYDVVAQQLGYVDINTGTLPAMHAFVDMGTNAVSYLFSHALTLDPLKNQLDISAAAWTLRNILGNSAYDVMLQSHKEHIPPHTYQILYSRDASF